MTTVKKFYLRPQPEYDGAEDAKKLEPPTPADLEKWLAELSDELAHADVIEIAVCDESSEGPMTTSSSEDCRRKAILVFNYSPCQAKLLDPERAAKAVLYRGPGQPVDHPGE